MRSLLTTTRILTVLALAATLTSSGALAQDGQTKGGQPSTAKSGMMSGNMDHCKQMMAMHTKMMANMKAMDSTLDRKVAAMNGAKGTAKVEAMADVINEMATQRAQMMAKMAGMQDQKMAHMGEHMAQPGSAAMKQSMTDCPMMKGMKGMDHK